MKGKPRPGLVRVFVALAVGLVLALTRLAGAVPVPAFEKDFKIRMGQQDKTLNPVSTQVYLLYSDAVSNIFQISSAIIEYRYDIDPFGDLEVKVDTLDRQQIETTFALGHLK